MRVDYSIEILETPYCLNKTSEENFNKEVDLCGEK